MHVKQIFIRIVSHKDRGKPELGNGLLAPRALNRINQDVTCRSKSIIENVVDKLIVLDICR